MIGVILAVVLAIVVLPLILIVVYTFLKMSSMQSRLEEHATIYKNDDEEKNNNAKS